MEFPKSLIMSALGASMLFSVSATANEYNRAEVFQAFYAYITQNTPIDPKFNLDDFALSDLFVAMGQVNDPNTRDKETRLREQFEWWLARRGDKFVSDDDGPGDGCVGGGAGSRDGDDDDCGGSDN